MLEKYYLTWYKLLLISLLGLQKRICMFRNVQVFFIFKLVDCYLAHKWNNGPGHWKKEYHIFGVVYSADPVGQPWMQYNSSIPIRQACQAIRHAVTSLASDVTENTSKTLLDLEVKHGRGLDQHGQMVTAEPSSKKNVEKHIALGPGPGRGPGTS